MAGILMALENLAPYLDDVATPSAYKVHYAIGGNALMAP
jgi:hypothetical protein